MNQHGKDSEATSVSPVLSKVRVKWAGDAVGYAGAWEEMQELAELLGAPVLLQSFSSLANFPNNDIHWQGELPGAQSAVFKYSDGPLIPDNVRQVYLTNNTWDIGKNYYGEAEILGDIKATLPYFNDHIREANVEGAASRNKHLAVLAAERQKQWDGYKKKALAQPISYYCVAGGSLGWSMPASLGIKLEPKQVIGAYGNAPGYDWHPATNDPEYLRIDRPRFDFVAVAKAAIQRGIEYVLTKDKAELLREMYKR